MYILSMKCTILQNDMYFLGNIVCQARKTFPPDLEITFIL